jgi:hypothetical protein
MTKIMRIVKGIQIFFLLISVSNLCRNNCLHFLTYHEGLFQNHFDFAPSQLCLINRCLIYGQKKINIWQDCNKLTLLQNWSH